MSLKTIGLACAALLLLCVAAAPAEDVLFSGDFAGKEGQRPASLKFDTPDTEFWKIEKGWLATGNGDNLVVTADGYSYAVVGDPGAEKWQDYRISCKFYTSQRNGSTCLVGRWTDRQNFYRADLDTAEGNTILRLVKVVKGTATTLLSQPVDLATLQMPPVAEGSADKPTLFSLSFQGNAISIQMNGRQMARQTDLDLKAGTAGVGERANQVYFADIKVIGATASGALPALAPAAIPTGGTEFGVLLSSDANAAASATLVRQLRMQGFLPIIVPDGDKQKVYVGRFASRQEAMRLQAQMVVEGFTFARVVEMTEAERVGNAAVAPATTASAVAAVPAAVLKDVGWEDLSPTQQQKILDMLMKSREQRGSLQSTSELMELKKQVNELSEKQKQIFVTIETAAENAENVRTQANQLIQKVNRAMDGRKWEEAKGFLDQLEKVQPDHPLLGIKRSLITTYEKGYSFEGEAELQEKAKKAIEQQKVKAGQLEATGDFVVARNIWMDIETKDPASADEARTKGQALAAKIEQQTRERETARENKEKERTKYFIALGAGSAGLLAFLLVFVYISGRMRYARMLQQMHEEAIAPLQELRERTRAIASGSPAGLGYATTGQSLLSEPDASSSEFMIPDTSVAEMPEPELELELEPEPAPSPVSGFEEPLVTPIVEAKSDSSDDFMIDFDSVSNEPPVQVADLAPQAPREELVFSFDKPANEPTGSAITATEVPEKTATAPEEIVFSFNDSPFQTASEKPAASEAIAAASPADSVYESISLDDLNLDFDISDKPAATQAATSELGDLDFKIDLPGLSADDQSATVELPGGNPLMAGLDFGQAEGQPGGGAEENGTPVLEQRFADEPIGTVPSGWTGESTDYAALQVAEDPADSDGKCLQFRKTEGRAPTSFSCRFPDVSGRVRVDFDLRCDEKNKHLLGLYIEADNDFRRSVHTVVQCTDPDRPAHLRVFTRPTPYTLGTWRHIRYTIDLNEGMVDGYVDDELVAEGVRMGTKTPILNTLSIRDNSETTGTMFVRNLVIGQL